ncbi:hypothetical protein B7494_g4780 [Chlorociboria aeruginascens]|nr:hypothetical protein B7494_g4780 [Chlorociboria aeruginascens]
MLRQATARSILPVLRPATATFRIASSTTWPRFMSRPNRPNGGQKEDGAPSNQPPQHHIHKGRNNATPGQPDSSRRPLDSTRPTSPQGNDTPQRRSRPSITPQTSQKKEGAPKYSPQHEELDTSASAEKHTAPQSTAPSAIDPAESQPKAQPLPDLTQGIPSTLEYELMEKSAKKSLNLTEAEEPEQSAGGRGRGELPASAYVSSSERKRLKLARYMYASFGVLFVATGIYLGRNWENPEEEYEHPNAPSGWALGLMWKRIKARWADQVHYYSDPAFKKLLPDPSPGIERPYTLVISLEDMLIHNEWSREHGWRIAKRPGVDYFLRYLSQYYELAIFTSQSWQVADPIIRKLDPFHIVPWPLFREATLYKNGEYIKDLSYLNRDLSKIILIDTKAAHAQNQPENAIILPPWTGDPKDKELVALIPFLEYIHTMNVPDVRKALASFEGKHIPTEFAEREAMTRKKFQEQLAEEKKLRKRPSGMGMLGAALGLKNTSMMVMDPSEQSPSEAYAQGKMLQDQARERGQRYYEYLEKEIKENGEKWLKDEAEALEKSKEEEMKAMRSGFTNWFSGSKPEK